MSSRAVGKRQVVRAGKAQVAWAPEQVNAGKFALDHLRRGIPGHVIHHYNLLAHSGTPLLDATQTVAKQVSCVERNNDERNVGCGSAVHGTRSSETRSVRTQAVSLLDDRKI